MSITKEFVIGSTASGGRLTARAPHPRALRAPRWLYAGLSVLLLSPCYWQPRLQAGDLSSHIYNAWLAQLIETAAPRG